MGVPRCLAIIPDGNRRWARTQGKPEIEGHRFGMRNARVIAEAAFKLGVQFLLLWGASESNFSSRPALDISHIFRLLKVELRRRLRQNDAVGFRICGIWQPYARDSTVVELVRLVEQKTASHQEHQLTLLFGYDGERDVEQACQKLFDARIRPTKQLIRQNLWTGHLRDANTGEDLDVDLLIRTGVEGDPHDSDAFLPLQRKHTQLLLTKTLWPAFTGDHLREAFENFQSRQRRKGA